MDWGIFWTIIGTGLGVVALIYNYLRNFRADLEKRIDAQDERIFLLATGKTLREAMIETKKKSEEKN